MCVLFGVRLTLLKQPQHFGSFALTQRFFLVCAKVHNEMVGVYSAPHSHSGTQVSSILWLCSSIGLWNSFHSPGKWIRVKTHALFTMGPNGAEYITSGHIPLVRNNHMASGRCKEAGECSLRPRSMCEMGGFSLSLPHI